MPGRRPLISDIDQRARRTRNALAQGLTQLAREKPIDSIKVGELAKAAGIGRATFYDHYGSMPDFLHRSFANMLERLARRERTLTPAVVLPVQAILSHLAASGPLGLAFLRSREWPAASAAGQVRLQILIDENLRRTNPKIPRADRSTAAVLISAGFMVLVEEWTRSGRPQPPEQIEASFQRFASAVLDAFVAPG